MSNKQPDFIELRFKLLFMAKVSLSIAISSLASGFFLYFYYSKQIGSVYNEAFLTIIEINRLLWIVIFITLLVSFLILSAATLILTLLVSHKIAGPLLALEKILKEISQKKFSHQEFCLRKNDQIKSLTCIFVNIGIFFGEKITAIKKLVSDLNSNFEKIDKLMRERNSDNSKLIGHLDKLIDETEQVVNLMSNDIKLEQ